MDDELDKALAKMRAKPADPMDAALAQIRGGQAAPTQGHDYHAEFQSGALQKRIEGANARDVASATDPNAEAVSLPKALLHSALATMANTGEGIPGFEAGQAGLRSVVRRQPYTEALSDIRRQTDKLPDAMRIGERMVGAAPVAARLPGGMIAGGALLGGADAALSADPMDASTRAWHTAAGTGVGALGGMLFKGGGNVAQRVGLTDALGSGIRSIGQDITHYGGAKIGGMVESVGNAMGTQGAAHRLLNDRQSILDQLSGSEKSAAQTMLDHVETYKQQAKVLYDAAKQDTKVVNDPRLSRIMSNPTIAQLFDVVGGRLGMAPTETVLQAGSKAVPRLTAGTPPSAAPPVPSDAPTSLLEAVKAFHERFAIAAKRSEGTIAQQEARAALERRSAEASLPSPPSRVVPATLNANPQPEVPEITGFLPSPEHVAMAKRVLHAIIEGKFNAPQGISSAEAAQLVPHLDQLRSVLHDASPAWKDADAFYAHAKNFETAFQKAYGAQQKATAGALDPKKLRTPEAIAAWVDRARGTPVGVARASGQQAGAAGRLGEALRNAPIGTDMPSTLAGANGVFQPSATAAAIRRPAFASDEAAQSFGSLIGAKSAKPSFGPASASALKPWQALSRQNPLETSGGSALRMEIATALADPTKSAALRAAMLSASSGETLLAALARLGIGSATAAVPTH